MALCLSSPGITQAETEVLPLSRMPFISSLENPPPRRRQLSALCAHPLPSATTESAGLSGLCISLSNCHASRDRMRSFQTCPCDPGGRLLSLPARSLDRVRCSPCWGRPPPTPQGLPTCPAPVDQHVYALRPLSPPTPRQPPRALSLPAELPVPPAGTFKPPLAALPFYFPLASPSQTGALPDNQ